ncbi:MAG: recombinase family protein [Methylotenera sp.]
MIYGYARVSTDKQDSDNQKAAILDYANHHDLGKVEYLAETVSSKSKQRAIFGLIDRLQAGDVLVVYELSRLARSMPELDSFRVKIAEKSATIRVISQNLTISPDGNDISTQAIVFALSLSAQIERNMISDRTKSALQTKKATGAVLGRPKGVSRLDSQKEEIQRYLAKGLNVTAIAKLIDCNRQTLTNWLKANTTGF